MWAQDADGQLERWDLVGRTVIQSDSLALDGRGVDGDVAGDLGQTAPVDGFIGPCAAAVDGSDWLRRSVWAFAHFEQWRGQLSR